ncbi:MAG: ankyrin repeat domain-containing protein [Gemmatimonadetes bacterium]|nr:ankyrin repeat domain-containing protein [Gemmatimonadota bacterium]
MTRATLLAGAAVLTLTGAMPGSDSDLPGDGWALPGPESPVADAAMRGDRVAVRELLADGADVNAAQGDGMTALHWAAEHGDVELARMLLHAGAAVAPATRIGSYAPLHIAARNGHTSLAVLLLEAGGDATAAAPGTGTTPLHLAAGAGVAELAVALIERGADVDGREAGWGQTPLMFAASMNRVDAIRALLDAGADPDITSRVEDLVVLSALDQLANRRRSDAIKALTADGARSPSAGEFQAAVRAARAVYAEGLPDDEEEEEDDFRPRRITAKGGLTALLHAVRQGHREAAAALLDGGADIDLPSASDGTSPLLMATINGQFDLALALIERGADPSIASLLNGATPLWAAVNARWQPRTRYPQPQEMGLQAATYLDVMEALLEAGADPDVRLTLHPWYMEYSGCGNRNCGLVDTEGATAFWRAAYATDVAAMRLLAAYGADPDIATKAPPQRRRLSPDESLRQQNRRQLASDSTYWELVDSAQVALMQSVRDELPSDMQDDFPDDRLDDPDETVRRELVRASEVGDSLRALEPDASGLPPVDVGGPGVWPIHASSGVGYGEGFAGNAHRHAPDGWLPAVRYLVEELGADVNARDHNGYNALHHAAARGDHGLIIYLVEQGADIRAISRRGQTVADLANGPVQRVSPLPATVVLLEKLGSSNSHRCLTC